MEKEIIIDLENASLADLKAAQESITTAIRKRMDTERSEALKAIKKLMDEYSIEPTDLGGKQKRQVKPAFIHPEKPDLTWAGRGKKPAWVKELEGQGVALESLRVKE